MSKELEALQDLSKLVFIYGGMPQYKIIEKSLKALEIIKKKSVNIHLLILSDSLEKYNFNLLPYRKLTQEEFDLIKKVLKNE